MLTKRGFMMRIRPIFVFMLIIGHVLGANLRVSAQIKANNPTLLQVSTLTPTPIIQVTREQAAALSTEGDRLLARNEFLLALDYYQEALSIYRTIHDRAGEVQTLIKIGNIYQNLG